VLDDFVSKYSQSLGTTVEAERNTDEVKRKANSLRARSGSHVRGSKQQRAQVHLSILSNKQSSRIRRKLRERGERISKSSSLISTNNIEIDGR